MNRVRLRKPASLRGRVAVAVLGLLTLLLLALFVAVDLALSARLNSDLRTRLEDRVTLASQLDGALSPQQLVDRLTGDGVQVQLCTPTDSTNATTESGSADFRCVSPQVVPGAGKPALPGRGRSRAPRGPAAPGASGGFAASKPAAPKPAASSPDISQDGSTLFVRATLPTSGQQLSLSVDSAEVGHTIRGLIISEIIGGLLVLVVAALLLGRVVGVALRPLDQMTGLARRIAGGDRGRRLGTGVPGTELGRTATAFDAMLDELETALHSADAARDRLRQFLGDASHELRSPLAGISARAEQLLRDEPQHAERELAYVAVIRESRRADRLVDDLLTVARFDQMPAQLQRERVDLVELARQESERVRLRGRELDLGIVGAWRAFVHGDPQRLAQIIGNVLDNAVRAVGDHGRIEVDIAPGEGVWTVQISDDGPGVPESERERIFERLVRLDASRARDTGGFGLGLPIARALARAHGGDLVCLPSADGARFAIVLPAGEGRLAEGAPLTQQ